MEYIWDSDDEVVYLQDLTENIWEDDTPIEAVLTRSGRVQPQDPPQQPPITQPIIPPLIEDNDIVKQLKKTKVEKNIWK